MAAITDTLRQATNGTRPSPTQLTASKAIGASSITCAALTGWPTATAVDFIIYNVDTNNNKIAGSQTDWIGVVSGTTITNLTLKAGTDAGYSIGAIVEAAPTAAWATSLVNNVLTHANQDGTLQTTAVQNALNLGNSALNGWNPLAYTLNTVAANGNRSYTLTFNGVDLTSTLSPGMRLRLTRTVTAPTQCTSLNGSTQYYSKTSPAGMTFTNNFVVSAWVKLNAYGTTNSVASRYNGTSGWDFQISSTGQFQLIGYNGGVANSSQITSYQSVPLNKWVHIAAQLDMATFTSSPTTSYCMIDGVDVPASSTRNGTNPTSLIQAGNLETGSRNGGLQPFPGKIAQVAIYSAKVTQATINASKDQTLAGTETSLISAYSFNNSINDLNANANNLTANGSAVATNADTPFGQIYSYTGYTNGSLCYGIVTSASFSTNTTLVVQVPEGDTIPTSGGVSALSYSNVKIPYGFPAQRGKWRIDVLDRTSPTQSSPVSGTWYNLDSLKITVPIGEWEVGYQANLFATLNASGGASAYSTLSTANNSESDTDLTGRAYANATASGSTAVASLVNRSKSESLAASTPLYLNIKSDASITGLQFLGGQGDTKVYAECALL